MQIIVRQPDITRLLLCRQHIIPRLHQLPDGHRNAVMLLILEELPTYLSEDPGIAGLLGSTAFVRTRSGTLRPPQALYDHRCESWPFVPKAPGACCRSLPILCRRRNKALINEQDCCGRQLQASYAAVKAFAADMGAHCLTSTDSFPGITIAIVQFHKVVSSQLDVKSIDRTSNLPVTIPFMQADQDEDLLGTHCEDVCILSAEGCLPPCLAGAQN